MTTLRGLWGQRAAVCPSPELLEDLPLGEIRVVRASRSHVIASNGTTARARAAYDTMTAAGPSEVAELSLAARAVHEVDPRPAGSRAHVYVLQGKLITGPVEVPTELGHRRLRRLPVGPAPSV